MCQLTSKNQLVRFIYSFQSFRVKNTKLASQLVDLSRRQKHQRVMSSVKTMASVEEAKWDGMDVEI